MMYLRGKKEPHQPKSSLLVRVAGATFVILLLIFFGGTFFGGWSGVAFSLAKPFWRSGVFFDNQLASISGFFTIKARLVEDNQLLREDLNRIKGELLNHRLLEAENKTLRIMLGREDDEKETSLARVLSGPGLNPYDVIVVDLGATNSQSSISPGDKVVADGAILLGQVAEVESTTAKIKLFSSTGTEVPVSIGVGATPGTAVGRGGGNFLVSLPRGIEVNVGDTVVAPALASDLILGIVGSVEKGSGSLQKILIHSPINVYQLQWVQIYAS